MLPLLGGSKACCRKLRLPRLIVSAELTVIRAGTELMHLPRLANFLRINIYLTQKINEDMLWNIAVNDAGAEYDPLTLLRTRTMFGRPDWKAIYGRMKQAIETGQYLPGTNSQLRTKVGVSDSSIVMIIAVLQCHYRPTSVVPASSPSLSKRHVLCTPVLPSTSPSPRYVEVVSRACLATHTRFPGTLLSYLPY